MKTRLEIEAERYWYAGVVIRPKLPVLEPGDRKGVDLLVETSITPQVIQRAEEFRRQLQEVA